MVCHSKARLFGGTKGKNNKSTKSENKGIKKSLSTYSCYTFSWYDMFTIKQRIIGHAIQELAKEMTKKEVSKIQNNTVISIDAARGFFSSPPLNNSVFKYLYEFYEKAFNDGHNSILEQPKPDVIKSIRSKKYIRVI